MWKKASILKKWRLLSHTSGKLGDLCTVISTVCCKILLLRHWQFSPSSICFPRQSHNRSFVLHVTLVLLFRNKSFRHTWKIIGLIVLQAFSMLDTWNEKRPHTKPELGTIHVWMLYIGCFSCVSCALCFLFWHKPIFRGNMASYCNSYNNSACAAAHSDDFVSTSCIWVFWQSAIMKA